MKIKYLLFLVLLTGCKEEKKPVTKAPVQETLVALDDLHEKILKLEAETARLEKEVNYLRTSTK